MKKLITLFMAVVMIASFVVSASAATSPIASTKYSVDIYNNVDTVNNFVKTVSVTAGETLLLRADGTITGFEKWNIGTATLVGGAVTDIAISIKPTADVRVYAIYKTGAAIINDPTTNVGLIISQNAAPPSAQLDQLVLRVNQVTQASAATEYASISKALKDVATNFVPYDISLLLNNLPIQPQGYVFIKLPIPGNMDPNNLAVYYVDDGVRTVFPFIISDSFAVIRTNHFSFYVLAEKDTSDKSPQTGVVVGSLAALMMASAAGFVFVSKKSK